MKTQFEKNWMTSLMNRLIIEQIQIVLSFLIYIITVLATKTRLLTLKSNISPLMESQTKLNIPIFFLVKSSCIKAIELGGDVNENDR